MGIDWRCLNGYIYISGNPVTDPAKIGERVEFFQKRAGYYYENWDDLYAKWRTKMEALIEELDAVEVPQLHEYEPDEVAFGDQETSYCAVLDAYRTRAAPRRSDVAEPFRVPAARLRRLHDVLRPLQGQPPDIPDQHIAQMVAGLDVLLFKPDAELRRLARLAIDTGVDGAFVEGRSPAEIDAALAATEDGQAWLAELESDQGPVVPHGHGRRSLPHLWKLVRRSERSRTPR